MTANTERMVALDISNFDHSFDVNASDMFRCNVLYELIALNS